VLGYECNIALRDAFVNQVPMSNVQNEYAKQLFDTEVEAALKHLAEFSKRYEVARALGESFGFPLPDWSNLPISGKGGLAKRGEAAGSTSPAGSSAQTNGGATATDEAPPMPTMIMEYFHNHPVATEPKFVDGWARETYPQADIKDYAIGQTMSRMANDGRLYSKKYKGEQSSVYGLPGWARPGGDPERGFKDEHLPARLRNLPRQYSYLDDAD
jgi:hypothetical protein